MLVASRNGAREILTDGYNISPKGIHDYIKLAMDFFNGKTLDVVIKELEACRNASEIELENKWHSLIMQYL